MSNSSDYAGVDAADLQFFITGNEMTIATTALYCYEWLVTLDQEQIFNASPRFVGFIPGSESRGICMWIIRLDDALQLFQVVALSLFTALRAFALSGQRTWVFILVFTLSVVPFFTNLVSSIHQEHNNLRSGSPCQHMRITYSNISRCTTPVLLFATRAAVIAADVIVLLITWQKTFGIIRQAASLSERMALSEVLLRDGTVFFLALLAVNVFQVLIHSVSSWSILLPGSAFLAPLTSIVVSRFFFNLRQVDEQPGDGSAPSSTMRFGPDMVVGNLSESLNFRVEDEDQSTISGGFDSVVDDEHSSGSISNVIEDQDPRIAA
ncbi:hypothetical protein BDY19DRAFT_461043 [Irpex rosettiformis]|uniref:Uncharacterized protein n=1 Tax=Irpex rosettiformis TaxID=378272 RepID=A0ACB8TSY7_9APHY|nr:hypothetical protein BDY19DRAFT_461043 [Irpex rosettiformis]